MTVSDVRTRAYEQDRLPDGPRVPRFGRLAPEPSTPAAAQVRCACDRCGAHLLASPRTDGAFAGRCPVCVGQCFTPVPAGVPQLLR